MILLDTCALLWLADDPSRLSPIVLGMLRQPGQRIYVSAFSAFELGVKLSKGKLGLPKPLKEWFPAVCARFGIGELPVSAAIAVWATELPPVHADPADRILIATALEHGLRLATPDTTIAKYPNLNTVW